MISDEHAEQIVKSVFSLRARGITDTDALIAELSMLYKGEEDDFIGELEAINTGGLRAAFMSAGHSYPPSNWRIEDDPIMCAAFKLTWIESKGEEHYQEFYVRKQNSGKDIAKRNPWWRFFG